MSATDSLLPDDDSGSRRLLLAVGVVLFLLFLVFGVVTGFGGLFGAIAATLYFLLTIAITALVLWLLYRLVVAAERIADAQERLARRRERSPAPDRE